MEISETKSESLSPIPRFKAFISYSHADSRAARWLHHALETYRVPDALRKRDGLNAKLGRLFLDRSELPSSSNLAATIQDALRNSENLIVICSPRAAGSRWVNQEIEFFQSLGRHDRIFCLIVEGEVGSVTSTPFPPALLRGLEPGVEPLAADLRPAQDGRSDAKLKIVAGLLDVGFDDLRQREAIRRQRRWAIAGSIGLALMLAMLLLTISAVVARNEAVQQRQTAVRTADFLRRLFKVSDPNHARGKEVTAREMLDRGARELTRSGELSDQPKVRAELLTTLAEVYVNLGLSAAAVKLVDQAGTLPDQDPIEVARRKRLLGEIAIFNSEYARAELLLSEALRLAGTDAKAKLPILLDQGELYKSTARFADAEKALDEGLKIARAQDPVDRDNATRALASLGGADFEAGNYSAAITRLRQVVTDRTDLSGPLHPEVAFALNTLGTVAIKQGDRETAARYFRAALERQKRVLGSSHPDVAITQANLARALVEGSEFADADALAEQAISIVLKGNDGNLDSLANMYDTLGLARGGRGKFVAARQAFSQSIRVARMHQMAKEGEAIGDLAELECMSGTLANGYKQLSAAREAYNRTQSTEVWRLARLDAVQARCDYRAGERASASKLSAKSRAAIVSRWGRGSLFERRLVP